MKVRPGVLSLVIATLFAAGCSDEDEGPTGVTSPTVPTDLRDRFGLEPLPEIVYPVDNPPLQERIALGRLLFYDPILSGERDVACGTCHHPTFAFADRRQFGAGVSGSGLGPDRVVSASASSGLEITLEPRNTPTIFNTAFNSDENGEFSSLGFQFWDGRVQGLEVQATKPITSRVEMRGDAYPGDDDTAAAAALDSVIARLRAVPAYEEHFRNAFPAEASRARGTVIDSSTYARAVAAFERELVTRNSAYDRYVDGEDDALTPIQKSGLELFFTKAKCATCHFGPMFASGAFVVQGVPQEGVGKEVIPGDDAGREEATLDPRHRYAFRTPTIRNAELTPPTCMTVCSRRSRRSCGSTTTDRCPVIPP